MRTNTILSESLKNKPVSRRGDIKQECKSTREPEAPPVAVRKQEFFIRNALIGHCLVTTLFPRFCKKFSAKYFLQASRKVLLVNFSAKRKSNNEKECFADRRSAIKPLFALTLGRRGRNAEA